MRDLNRAVAFYEEDIALPLAHFFPDRRVAFFWIGVPERVMLGLGDAGTMPITVSQHVAFEVSFTDLHKAPERLRRAGIKARDFAGQSTEEPRARLDAAAAAHFHDPDSNLLEFITVLPDEPRPELEVLPWSKWLHRMPTDGVSMSKR